MREAETESHEGKRKVESLWPIFRIHHQRSRYIYDLFYRRKAISRELYDYCLKEKIADQNLIAKWRKQGYENLCCLRCIQARDTNFGTNCVCRVPKSKLEEGKIVECVHCGCRGCSGWGRHYNMCMNQVQLSCIARRPDDHNVLAIFNQNLVFRFKILIEKIYRIFLYSSDRVK